MGARWSGEERAALLRAISVHSCRWSLIASHNLVPGRSARALRNKYSRTEHLLSPSAPPSTVSCAYDADVSRAWPRLPQCWYSQNDTSIERGVKSALQRNVRL